MWAITFDGTGNARLRVSSGAVVAFVATKAAIDDTVMVASLEIFIVGRVKRLDGSKASKDWHHGQQRSFAPK